MPSSWSRKKHLSSKPNNTSLGSSSWILANTWSPTLLGCQQGCRYQHSIINFFVVGLANDSFKSYVTYCLLMRLFYFIFIELPHRMRFKNFHPRPSVRPVPSIWSAVSLSGNCIALALFYVSIFGWPIYTHGFWCHLIGMEQTLL